MTETTLASTRRWGSRQHDPLRNFKFFVEFEAASNAGTMFNTDIKRSEEHTSELQSH